MHIFIDNIYCNIYFSLFFALVYLSGRLTEPDIYLIIISSGFISENPFPEIIIQYCARLQLIGLNNACPGFSKAFGADRHLDIIICICIWRMPEYCFNG